MNQVYSEKIKEHYLRPRKAGQLAHFTHTAEQINPLCGDETKVYLVIQKNVIREIAHETRGCMIAVSAASVVSEHARGKSLPEIKKLGVEQISKLLGIAISPARASCATLLKNSLEKI